MSNVELKKKREKFVALILEWFQKHGREFSWRTLDLTPFQHLVAELMLQKTGASQVEGLFPEFIKKHPDAASILAVEEEALAETLRPLGLFNRRARDLKKTAKLIVENDNVVPNTIEDLKALPGVGNYIARALSCFAFQQPVPILDANVGRVMKRVFSFPVKGAPSRDKKLAQEVEKIIPEEDFQELNYGILDLGALVCLPRNPRCEECPLWKICDSAR